jgi:hypothetical protein
MTLYVKFFPENLTLNEFKYNLGRNVDIIEFNPIPQCVAGGLYYTDFENMAQFTSYGSIIGIVKIDDGIPIVKINTNTYKSPEINILEFYDFEEFISNKELYTEEKTRIKDPVLKFRLKENPSEEFKIATVKNNGLVIEYIKDPSESVQLAAVIQNGFAIQHIEEPSEDVQLAAVNSDADVILFIKDPSKELKLVYKKAYGY